MICGKYYVDDKGAMVCSCYVYNSKSGNYYYYWVNESGTYESRWTTKVKPEGYTLLSGIFLLPVTMPSHQIKESSEYTDDSDDLEENTEELADEDVEQP